MTRIDIDSAVIVQMGCTKKRIPLPSVERARSVHTLLRAAGVREYASQRSPDYGALLTLVIQWRNVRMPLDLRLNGDDHCSQNVTVPFIPTPMDDQYTISMACTVLIRPFKVVVLRA